MIHRRQDFLGIVDDLAPSHLPHLPVGQLDQWHTGRLRKRDNLLMGGWGWGWERSQIIRQRENLVLYKSFNALCVMPVYVYETPIPANGFWTWLSLALSPSFSFLRLEKTTCGKEAQTTLLGVLCIYSVYYTDLLQARCQARFATGLTHRMQQSKYSRGAFNFQKLMRFKLILIDIGKKILFTTVFAKGKGGTGSSGGF